MYLPRASYNVGYPNWSVACSACCRVAQPNVGAIICVSLLQLHCHAAPRLPPPHDSLHSFCNFSLTAQLSIFLNLTAYFLSPAINHSLQPSSWFLVSSQQVSKPLFSFPGPAHVLLQNCTNSPTDRVKLLNHHPTLCLEVGCGSGYVITSLALMLGKEASGTHYIATDINPHAIRVTQETLEAHGVHAELVSTDIASGLEKRLAGSVDVLVVNPPYVPTPEDEVGRGGIAAAWAGGENGRSVINRILPVADVLLSDKGWLYMVTLTANNPSQICLQMREKGYASRIVVQRSTEEESLHALEGLWSL
ncbi:unnamed protein product [Citrullus colocynthis]|uniref:Methyltransferase small domain-containing protein n=1 Tax=Citrullus colocynthis TaxID=252529 RepID=A0ABP0Y5H4_9ROSI